MFSAEYVRFECSAEALWEYYMKRFQRLIFVAALALAAISCSSGGDDDHGMSLTEQLNSGTVVDLEGKSFSEDAAVNSAVTIKNGNFGGKTITVNSGNVVLDNVQNLKLVVSDNVTDGTVTIRNSKGSAVTVVVKGGSAITIQDSAVLNISVEKPNAAVNLSGTTTVSAVDVKADGASIKSDSSAMVTNVSVGADVRNIAIEGGTVGVVDAGTATVTVGDGVKINDTTGGKFVVSDNTVKLPADAEKLTISRVDLIKGSAKTAYEEGDRFDFTGLSATVTYSDGNTATVNLTAANTKVNGFNTGKVGSCTVTFEYMGKPVSGLLSVTVKESTKEYKMLLEEGVQLLFDTKYDEGVAKIRAAYEKEQNDETKMYYALAEIATISTDKSVADIMRNNFGVTSYPSTLNALINGDWIKEYVGARYVDTYEIVDSDYDSWHVLRVSGTETDSYNIADTVYVELEQVPNVGWIRCSDYYDREIYITNIKLDDNGKYFITEQSNYVRDLITDSTKYYDYNWADEKFVRDDDWGSTAPDFDVPDWLGKSDKYKNSLIGTTQTAYSVSYLLYGNLIHYNSDGLNGLVDNVLLVFGDKFENAKKLAAEISDSSVTVPADVITALNLNEVLGDSSIRIGKSELNVLIASMQILKGTFQWLSSYDLSANISSLKKIFAADETDSLKLIRDVISEKTFAIRNADAMTASKNTFLESIGILDNSYTYLVGPSCEYPQAAKDALKQYGDVLLPAARNLKSCISDGTVFYIPSENPFDSGTWAASEANSSFGIDMGKAFTPGYFSKILKCSDSTITFVGSAETRYYGQNAEGNYVSETSEEEIAISDSMSYDDVISKENEKAVVLQKKYSMNDYNGYLRSYIDIGIKLNKDVLNGLLPGLSFESVTIPIRSSDSEYEVEPFGKLYIMGDMTPWDVDSENSFILMDVKKRLDSTCIFTYEFVYNEETMRRWGGSLGRINFKLISKNNWNGGDWGGKALVLNSEAVSCEESWNSANFTCNGLKNGSTYVVTAQKSVTGEIMIKIEGDVGPKIPILDKLTATEMKQPGACILIEPNNCEILSQTPICFEERDEKMVASINVKIPASNNDFPCFFSGRIHVGGTADYWSLEEPLSVDKDAIISDVPVRLLVSNNYWSNINTNITAELDKDVNFTITITADENGSTICATLTE